MTRPRILLVDDDSAFRHVMAGELRRLGHEVTVAGTLTSKRLAKD